MRLIYVILVFCCIVSCQKNETDSSSFISRSWSIVKADTVDYCTSDFSVGFSLYKKDDAFYVAYYDTNHILTVASKHVDDKIWKYKKIDSKVDWDSHKYLTLVVDDNGYIHLAGNMHVSPLTYYKSLFPYKIETLQKMTMIQDENESAVTYPQFMFANGRLLFHYRSGTSGNGIEIFNYYDSTLRHWIRLLNSPLFDGKGLSNAYMEGPVLGEDGYFHLIWVWRDTSDCRTNHGLYYARSKDLQKWEDIKGNKKIVPIDIYDDNFMVDNIPVGGGLLNIGFKLGFSDKGEPLIVYHKYDERGNTNIFCAYIEEHSWVVKQITDWDWRWNFGGTGSIICELELKKSWSIDDFIYIIYNRQLLGYKEILFDRNNLCVNYEGRYDFYPNVIDDLSTSYPGLIVNKIFDAGDSKLDFNHKYLLRYEGLNVNRDTLSENVGVPNSVLELYEIRK